MGAELVRTGGQKYGRTDMTELIERFWWLTGTYAEIIHIFQDLWITLYPEIIHIYQDSWITLYPEIIHIYQELWITLYPEIIYIYQDLWITLYSRLTFNAGIGVRIPLRSGSASVQLSTIKCLKYSRYQE